MKSTVTKITSSEVDFQPDAIKFSVNKDGECTCKISENNGTYVFKSLLSKDALKDLIRDVLNEYKMNNITEIQKIKVDKDDILVQKIPCFDNDILMDYETAYEYHKALEKHANCSVVTIPEYFNFELCSIEDLKKYRNDIDEVINKESK